MDIDKSQIRINNWDILAITSAIAGTASAVALATTPVISFPLVGSTIVGSVLGVAAKLYSSKLKKESLINELTKSDKLLEFLKENGYVTSKSSSVSEKVLVNQLTNDALVIPNKKKLSSDDIENILSKMHSLAM